MISSSHVTKMPKKMKSNSSVGLLMFHSKNRTREKNWPFKLQRSPARTEYSVNSALILYTHSLTAMLVTSWKPPPSLGQPFLRLISPLSRGGSLDCTPLFLRFDPVPPPPDLVLTYPAWRGFLGGSLVKNPSLLQEMWEIHVRSLGLSIQSHHFTVTFSFKKN